MKKALFLAIVCLFDPFQTIQAHPAEEIGVFFNYAKEKLPKLSLEIADAQKETPLDTATLKQLQEQLKTFKIINLIAERNIEALKEMSPEELELTYRQICVDSDRFKDTMRWDNRLVARMLGGENALVFALFHSATNQTKEDNEKTVAMLEILLNKGLNPNPQATFVYWVKDNAADTDAKDYVRPISLPQIALLYSFPQALELLLKHGATFDPDVNVVDIINAIKKAKNTNHYPYLSEFEPILSKYLVQSQQ